jgi:hypothetical protein
MASYLRAQIPVLAAEARLVISQVGDRVIEVVALAPC